MSLLKEIQHLAESAYLNKLDDKLFYLVYEDSFDKAIDLYDDEGYDNYDEAMTDASKFQEEMEMKNDDGASYAMFPITGEEIKAKAAKTKAGK